MRQQRWLELIKEYDCIIIYHPRKTYVFTNALSRRDILKYYGNKKREGRQEMVNAMTVKLLLSKMIKVAQENQNVEQDQLLEKEKFKCHIDHNGILRYGDQIWIP